MSQVRGETSLTSDDRTALEAFVVDNPELEQLEALLEQFNIFEAIGVVRLSRLSVKPPRKPRFG